MSRRLHIGGKTRAEGWEVLNANPAPYVDHVCNANDLSQFADNTFIEIYASHIVEHFDYVIELQNTLKEWFRVLKPDGKIYISVPDLDVLARLILDKEKLTANERFNVMRMIFGGHVDKYDYHLVGLNEEFLTRILQDSGYAGTRRVRNFGLFDDTSSMAFKGVPISLNLVAEKRLASEESARADRAYKALMNGHWQEAIAAYEHCIEIEPDVRINYWNLGVALLVAGREVEAQGTWFGVLFEASEEELEAWTTELYKILAVTGAELLERQQLAEAERCLQQALELEVSNADAALAYNSLGTILRKRGDLLEAIESYEAAIDRDPLFSEPVFNLALLYKAQGRNEAAIATFQGVLEIDPHHLETLNQLGELLHEQGDVRGAIAAYQKALEVDASQAEIQYKLGTLLSEQGDNKQAIVCFQKSIELDPSKSACYYAAGVVLQRSGQIDAAMEAYHQAIRIDPNNALAHHALGIIFKGPSQRELSLDHHHKALAIDPTYVLAYIDIAINLFKQGRVREGLKYCNLSQELKSEVELSYSFPLILRLYRAECDARETHALACNWAEQFTKNAPQYSFASRQRAVGKRLRIGYVSPDFRNHPVARFLTPILSNHHQEEFEVFCYAEVARPDETTAQMRALASHWSSTIGRSDAEVADEIYRDEIDILIDVAGHTGGNRLKVFGSKPAPVQITCIGYPNTTGLATMDYRLTDAWADPVGEGDDGYTETLVRLPECFLCFSPSSESPAVSSLPARENGYVTYGSFNNIAKVAPETIATWARILHAVPTARIVLKYGWLADPATCNRFWEMFESQGIARERVELREYVAGMAGHLSCYHEVDIALDPFPYNGTTTTCDALWMGVPVVSLAGDRHVQRVGRSLLHAVGLPELVAHSEEEYIAKAVELSRDLERLGGLRGQLREQMATSTLCDAPHYVQGLEATYRQLWQDWCQSDFSG